MRVFAGLMLASGSLGQVAGQNCGLFCRDFSLCVLIRREGSVVQPHEGADAQDKRACASKTLEEAWTDCGTETNNTKDEYI